MSESPIHWFKPYSGYRRCTLSTSQSTVDPFLLFEENKNELEGLVRVQVDDTICAGTSYFNTDERNGSTEFPNRGHRHIGIESSRSYSLEIGYKPDGEDFVMNQTKYISEFKNGKFQMIFLLKHYEVFEQNTLWNFS